MNIVMCICKYDTNPIAEIRAIVFMFHLYIQILGIAFGSSTWFCKNSHDAHEVFEPKAPPLPTYIGIYT